MKLENLDDLFIEQLKDLYSAEKQLTKALPKMAEKAHAPELKEAFQMHLGQTNEHVSRLEEVFKSLNHNPESHTCKAMEGLIAEGEEMMNKDAKEAVLDAGLIAAAQKVEHYEIASYGTACTYAKQLGHNAALNLLKATLGEEKNTDEKLTMIAESRVNKQAE